MKPAPATIPAQPCATARWWALRWYKNASVAERAAMRDLLDECGAGLVQQSLFEETDLLGAIDDEKR